jgi:hypothetical protein
VSNGVTSVFVFFFSYQSRVLWSRFSHVTTVCLSTPLASLKEDILILTNQANVGLYMSRTDEDR